MSTATVHPDPAIRRTAWALAGVIALSFAFGVAMFIPAQNRAAMIQSQMVKYQARRYIAEQKIQQIIQRQEAREKR